MTAPDRLEEIQETARLAKLDSYGILDTPAEKGFDDIVLLASQLCDTPVALVSLVASDRQWFKAKIGLDACETPLSQSVCAHTLLQPGLSIIPDLTADPRTSNNTFVTGAPYLRFYAGARLEAPTGEALGTLCVIDTKPRPEGLTEKQRIALEALARQVVMQLELRRTVMMRDAKVVEFYRERSSLWELSSDIMLRCSFDGIIKSVNPAWTSVLGWQEDELLGTNLFSLIHPDDFESTTIAAGELAQGDGHARFDNRYRHKNGDYRWITWSTRAGQGLINAVGRDFTEEHDRTEALRVSEAALRQSQKMEAVGQLTGGLAHDFNNLLAVITGSLELLALRVSQGRVSEIDRFVTAAQTAAKRASSLTHRLLAFSRRQTLDPKPTAIDRLVVGIEDMIQRTVGPGIAIEMALTDGLWNTRVDPHQLENALLNLCINARDAMPDGGKLSIETANHDLGGAIAASRDMPPGEYVALSVSDTGSGMTPEVIARAFEPFFTTKPMGLGTGLGLSMIYGFARQSDGQVRIHSEVGKGTTVTIFLPRSEDGLSIAEEAETIAKPGQAERGQTVLVVDDEANIRMLVVDVLSDLGYSAIEAHDGPAALKILQSDIRIDLLVTDVGMPGGMNGRQVADAGRAIRPGLKTLFITGYAENAVVSHGHLEQGMAIVTKPFALDVLANRVKDLISEGSSGQKL